MTKTIELRCPKCEQVIILKLHYEGNWDGKAALEIDYKETKIGSAQPPDS